MDFLRRHSRAFIFIMTAICLVSVIATALARRKPVFLYNAVTFAVSPLQRAVTGVSWWFEDKVNFLTQMDSYRSENETLKKRNAELEEEIKRLQLMELESIKLSELYMIDQKYPQYVKTGAEIIAADPSDWVDAYTVNKGTDDGIAPYMAVLGPGGLFGMVTESSAVTSTIISLLDDRSSISAKSVRTEDRGFVKGASELIRQGLCRMDFIEPDAKIMVGDEIITSSMSAFYPAGLTIGIVTEIIPDPNGLTMYAVIEPSVDMSRLETVLIILDTDD